MNFTSQLVWCNFRRAFDFQEYGTFYLVYLVCDFNGSFSFIIMKMCWLAVGIVSLPILANVVFAAAHDEFV